MKAIITFLNGETLEVEQNGSSYILDKKPVFPQDLSIVTVKNEKNIETFKNVEIIECASIDGRFWFGFYQLSESEIRERQFRADLDYIAAMSDIEI